MGALHHAASRSVDRSVLLQVNRFLQSARLTRFAATALRVALAAGFLSAVADRFGLWGNAGYTGRSLGRLVTFFDVHRQAELVSARFTHTDRGCDCHTGRNGTRPPPVA